MIRVPLAFVVVGLAYAVGCGLALGWIATTTTFPELIVYAIAVTITVTAVLIIAQGRRRAQRLEEEQERHSERAELTRYRAY